MNLSNRIRNRVFLEYKKFRINLIKKSFIPEDQILIFSDPRGGSTWLSELMNCIPKTMILWEPLNKLHVKEIQYLNFGWRQFIPENEEWPEAKCTFDKILSGKIRNEWTLLRTDVKSFEEANKMIVKLCRGNALLPWMVNQYEFNFKPLYLIRHPFAVVNSQLKQGGWNSNFAKFQVPDIPYNELYQKHQKFLSNLRSKEEVLTAIWCLTNKIPIESKSNNKYIKIHYEDLVIKPNHILEMIFNNWGISMPDKIHTKIRKASSTSLEKNDVSNYEEFISQWKRQLSKKQILKMSVVLRYFGIELYTGNSIFPTKSE